MSEVQIAIIDQEDTQITLAVPGVQGPAGAISSGGSANQVFYKVSGTNYDAGWTFIGNANVDAAAAIAGTKISPNFGSQTIATTGVFSHALGAAATPSITFTGDLNTGIFSPGADQVAVATNGTERLTVDTAATTSTLPVVHPLGAAATPSITFTGDLNTGIFSPGADQVAISTGGSGRLFIKSNGDVTVGHTSSSYSAAGRGLISVNGSSSSLLDLQTGTTSRFRMFCNGTTTELVNTEATGNLVFGTNSTERLRITSAGLVGIGTSSPQVPLDLISDASGYGIAVRGRSADNLGSIRFTANNYSATYSELVSGATYFALNVNSAERLRVDSSGRVGIGTTSPAKQLHIENTSNDVTLRIGRNGYVQTDLIGSTGAGANDFKITQNGFDRFVIEYGGNSAARIDSSGRLLVGTSSDFDGYLNQVSSSSGTLLSLRRTNSNPGSIKLSSGASGDNVGSGSQLGYLRWYGFHTSADYEAARIEAQVDGTPGANDMPGRLVFSTTADGSASPTERLRITSTGQVRLAGAGITFNGDTAAANELDDYEEGTFTPSVGGNATYTSRSGAYTKIGRKVSVVGQIVINTIGTGSATTVSDLPFASSVLAPVYVGIFQNLAINVVFLLGTIPASTSRIDFTSIATAGGTAPNDASVIGSGTRIDFAATYFI